MEKILKSAAMLVLLLLFGFQMKADVPMRRPISPERPLWIVHVDTWNAADPERIIEMVPEDIRPYCVFNISLSATDAICCNGYDVCDSWLKACANKQVWSMVQCASGSHSRFPDNEFSVYEDYFRKYPNFIGWNFAEQFWGFGDEGQPSFPERLALFGEILKICQRYGGYLVVSFTQSYYSCNMMPIAYMKRNAEVNRILSQDPEHFICCEKYTMSNGFYGIESECLGAWLGGYAGQYGIRFDACGWSSTDSSTDPYVKASGAMPIMEHVMLTGETVIDGPETITEEVSREVKAVKTSDGFTQRQWSWLSPFVNINIDEFRKILDGTVRILTRNEVIDRTKICVRNDLEGSGNRDYLSPETMFDGLYRPDCDHGSDEASQSDNAWLNNRWWLKSTGRYPTLPYLYDRLDGLAQQLKVVNVSEYNDRWPTVADKVAEFNSMFPEEYTGDIYAAHAENTWMTYNPYQYDDTRENGARIRKTATQRAGGNVPFQYNTASSLDLDFAPYGMAVVKEYPDSVMLYLTNFRTKQRVGDAYIEAESSTDIVRIHGASSRPEVRWFDRANHRASEVKETWADGVLTLEVTHNGPIEFDVKCSGNATGRLTHWTPARIETPEQPPLYLGTLQYEAEHFEYKNIANCYSNGYNYGNAGYQGQGFVDVGSNAQARLRDTIYVNTAGTYNMAMRYKATNGGGKLIVKINTKNNTVELPQTPDEWTEFTTPVELKAGANPIEMRYTGTAFGMLFDCVKFNNGADEPYAHGMTLSQSALTGIAQSVNGEDCVEGVLTVSAYGMKGAVTASADDDAFEMSWGDSGVWKNGAATQQTQAFEACPLHVRLKTSAAIGSHNAVLTLSAPGLEPRTVDISGMMNPNAVTLIYDFEEDTAGSAATTPPATDISVGEGNNCTAGVVSVNDINNNRSNMLKIFSATSNNSTGVLNFNRFTDKSTDYSVTWRQIVVPSSTYKNGFLLRGDINSVGTATTGYTQGMMAGYYFSVYNNGANTEFRIYKSTAATTLSMLTNRSVELAVTRNKPLYYRASVSGSEKVKLMLEYSLDGETWLEGSSTTDENSPYTMGATQFVWGLAAATRNFSIDDVRFDGITYDEAAASVEKVEAANEATVVAEEYFDLQGRRIASPAYNGIIICRRTMSDGSVNVVKITGRRSR